MSLCLFKPSTLFPGQLVSCHFSLSSCRSLLALVWMEYHFPRVLGSQRALGAGAYSVAFSAGSYHRLSINLRTSDVSKNTLQAQEMLISNGYQVNQKKKKKSGVAKFILDLLHSQMQVLNLQCWSSSLDWPFQESQETHDRQNDVYRKSKYMAAFQYFGLTWICCPF